MILADRKRPGPAPGIGDRVLARLTPVKRVASPSPRASSSCWSGSRSPCSASSASRRRRPHRAGRPQAEGDGARARRPRRGQGRRPGFGHGDALGGYGLPRARVREVIGSMKGERAVSLIAIHAHGIPNVFPPEVLAEANAAKPAGMANREDWRTLPLVTIDPPDAKDHDDAVHAEPDPDPANGRPCRHRRDRRRRLLRASRHRPRPRGAEARQLGLFPRPRRADAAGADLQRPLLASRGRGPPGPRRPHGLLRRRPQARPSLPSRHDALGGEASPTTRRRRRSTVGRMVSTSRRRGSCRSGRRTGRSAAGATLATRSTSTSPSAR